MSTLYLPGVFPLPPSGWAFPLTFEDWVEFLSGQALEVQRSSGIKFTVAHPNTPGPNQRWTIISLSLSIFIAVRTDFPVVGKLGHIYGGIMLDPVIAIGHQEQNFSPIPTPDQSLITSLFDPDVDPSPPTFNPNHPPTSYSQLLYCPGTVSPPVPRQIYPGQQITVGLWVSPSILTNPSSEILAAGLTGFGQIGYNLVVDDGI